MICCRSNGRLWPPYHSNCQLVHAWMPRLESRPHETHRLVLECQCKSWVFASVIKKKPRYLSHSCTVTTTLKPVLLFVYLFLHRLARGLQAKKKKKALLGFYTFRKLCPILQLQLHCIIWSAQILFWGFFLLFFSLWDKSVNPCAVTFKSILIFLPSHRKTVARRNTLSKASEVLKLVSTDIGLSRAKCSPWFQVFVLALDANKWVCQNFSYSLK